MVVLKGGYPMGLYMKELEELLYGGTNMNRQTRSPKQLGVFGESLVAYALIKKGYEVAYVDHIGADLIAEKNDKIYAISVKFRLFRKGSNESRMVNVTKDGLEKLKKFSKQFKIRKSLFAQVISIADDRKIHLFIIPVDKIEEVLSPTKSGYSLNFGQKKIHLLTSNENVDYSFWENETIGEIDFS